MQSGSRGAHGESTASAQGIARADKTLRNIRSAWIKEQQVRINKGNITEYQVNMLITFVLE